MTNAIRLRRSLEGETRAQDKFESLRNSKIDARRLELIELYEKEEVNFKLLVRREFSRKKFDHTKQYQIQEAKNWAKQNKITNVDSKYIYSSTLWNLFKDSSDPETFFSSLGNIYFRILV